MGYLKLTTSDLRMKAKVTPLARSGEVNLRARRLAPPPANGDVTCPASTSLLSRRSRSVSLLEAPLQGASLQGASLSRRVDQRFETRQQAPQVQRAQAAAAPIAASPRGMRTLIGVLILVALLPSALFAAMISFGAIHLNWPAPWLKTQAATWPSAPASVAGALPQEKPQAQSEPKSPVRRRDGQRSARAPRAAKCSRGGTSANARPEPARWAGA